MPPEGTPEPGEQPPLFDPKDVSTIPSSRLVETPGGRIMTQQQFFEEAKEERDDHPWATQAS